MILTWHGHTTFLESLFIIPGGFGNGIALSATFIGLTAGVDPCQVAIASSGLYLSSNIGQVGGLSVAAAVLQSTLKKQLRISLEGMDDREMVSSTVETWTGDDADSGQIINRALSDIGYVTSLKGLLGEIVTEAYVKCLTYTHGKPIPVGCSSFEIMLIKSPRRCFTCRSNCVAYGGFVY